MILETHGWQLISIKQLIKIFRLLLFKHFNQLISDFLMNEFTLQAHMYGFIKFEMVVSHGSLIYRKEINKDKNRVSFPPRSAALLRL